MFNDLLVKVISSCCLRKSTSFKSLLLLQGFQNTLQAWHFQAGNMFCIISMACLCGPWEKEILFLFVVHSYRPSAQDNYKWKHFLSSEILIPAAQVLGWSFQYISVYTFFFSKLSCFLVSESVEFFINLWRPCWNIYKQMQEMLFDLFRWLNCDSC